MKRYLALSLIACLISVVALAGEPSPQSLELLLGSPKAAEEAYRVYAEKYANRTPTDEVEMSDSKARWKVFSLEAKALWEVFNSLEEGESIFKYPGLLAHGRLSWNDEKKIYLFGFGFHPFSAGDGLGAGSISFDLSGKVTDKRKAKYPW
jgi:hypothetical protein